MCYSVTVMSSFFFWVGGIDFLRQGNSNSPGFFLLGAQRRWAPFIPKHLPQENNDLLNCGVFFSYRKRNRQIPVGKKVKFGFTYDTPVTFVRGSLRICKKLIFFFFENIIFWRRDRIWKRCTNRNKSLDIGTVGSDLHNFSNPNPISSVKN